MALMTEDKPKLILRKPKKLITVACDMSYSPNMKDNM